MLLSRSTNGTFLTGRRSAGHFRVALFAALVSLGCSSPRAEFLGNRALDTCSEAWPICGSVAGCVLGPQSYVEGRFPGKARFIVRVPEPAVVWVSIYLEGVSAAGEETSIDWHEDRCRAFIRETVDGEGFVGESQRAGFFQRSAELIGVGDHLIEVRSDSEADYLIKVDMLPTRLDQASRALIAEP